MRAYKGVSKDMKGHGGYVFRQGETYREETSKTVRSGFHCAENPFVCLNYFPLGRGNRFFVVEAGGDINEDGEGRVACTELKVGKELSLQELAAHGMMYMLMHPSREWEMWAGGAQIASWRASADKNGIAIARGENPAVKGENGSVLGLMVERDGSFVMTALETVGGALAEGVWYTLDEEGRWIQVENQSD